MTRILSIFAILSFCGCASQSARIIQPPMPKLATLTLQQPVATYSVAQAATLPTGQTIIIPVPMDTNNLYSVYAAPSLTSAQWLLVASNHEAGTIIVPNMGQCGFYRIVATPKNTN